MAGHLHPQCQLKHTVLLTLVEGPSRKPQCLYSTCCVAQNQDCRLPVHNNMQISVKLKPHPAMFERMEYVSFFVFLNSN